MSKIGHNNPPQDRKVEWKFPYVIDVLITDKIMAMNSLEIQDNGRNIWEQTEKKLLRTYNSKGGLKLKKNDV